jgi:hypothetical protein
MTEETEVEFDKKTVRMINAGKAIKKLAHHYYSREEIVQLMNIHRAFTQIIELKRDEVLLREGKQKSNIILPGDMN